VSRILYDRNPSSGREQCRHVRHLAEQMYGHQRVKRSPRRFERLWIHRQEYGIDVNEDRPMTRGNYGRDQRRVSE
jgi:hypothetical protein